LGVVWGDVAHSQSVTELGGFVVYCCLTGSVA
jgi:hypothetical protein